MIMTSPGHMSSLKSVNATLCVEIRLKLCNVLPPALTIHALRVLLMRSTNHRKYPTRSYRNDSDFVSFGDSSASVLVTRNAARFDGELSTTGQISPAESILSGRPVADMRIGYTQEMQDFETAFHSGAKERTESRANEPVFFRHATLFDSVMDFLDRRDRMITRQQSIKSAD